MIGFTPQRRTKLNVVSVISSFTTNFPLTESPISGYLLGLANGTDWKDVNSNGGSAYGTGASAGYDDCVACKTGFTGNHHSSQITVKKVAGYTAPSSHEVECLTGWNIASHVITGYEFDIDFAGTGSFVRWNGALGNFTIQGAADDNLATGKGWTDVQTGTMPGIVDGDVVRVDYDATGSPLLKAYLNGVLKITVSDTTVFKITSGNPGFGFFARAGAGLDMTKYCISSWTGASL